MASPRNGSFYLPLEGCKSLNDYNQKYAEYEARRQEAIQKTLAKGHYRLVNIELRADYECVDVATGKTLFVSQVKRPDGVPMAMAHVAEPGVRLPGGGMAGDAVRDNLARHLEAIKAGRRKLVDAMVTKLYFYEMTLDDGSKTIFVSGGDMPLEKLNATSRPAPPRRRRAASEEMRPIPWGAYDVRRGIALATPPEGGTPERPTLVCFSVRYALRAAVYLMMPHTPDNQLLAGYVRERSQAAFAGFVTRRIGLVHAVALPGAESGDGGGCGAGGLSDAGQKAASLLHVPDLAGWLFQTRAMPRRTRSSVRRRGGVMNRRLPAWLRLYPAADFSQVDVDALLARLGTADRHALLLRYYEARSLAEVGAASTPARTQRGNGLIGRWNVFAGTWGCPRLPWRRRWRRSAWLRRRRWRPGFPGSSRRPRHRDGHCTRSFARHVLQTACRCRRDHTGPFDHRRRGGLSPTPKRPRRPRLGRPPARGARGDAALGGEGGHRGDHIAGGRVGTPNTWWKPDGRPLPDFPYAYTSYNIVGGPPVAVAYRIIPAAAELAVTETARLSNGPNGLSRTGLGQPAAATAPNGSPGLELRGGPRYPGRRRGLLAPGGTCHGAMEPRAATGINTGNATSSTNVHIGKDLVNFSRP